MLTVGETFNERKAFLWSFIHVCQELIGVLQKLTGDKKSAREVIVLEREIIKDTYAELKELQRWFKQSGLKANEPFSFKKEG